MALTFTPAIPPQQDPTADISFISHEIRFGEGYVQAMGDGLNDKNQVWPLTWVGTNAEIKAITDFFDLHVGYKSFNWTPPVTGAVAGLYRIKRYQLMPSAAGNGKVTATLEQVYYP